MQCPLCRRKSGTWLVDSRPRTDGSLRRRHECRQCRVRWSTHEVIVSAPTPCTPLPGAQELPPELPHCSRCQQWQPRQQRCGLGFPESQFEADFAISCLHYQLPAAA